ncbi:MAG: hypothetical protein JSW62_03155 [Thermoplasmatales archaeon]|nr:MAG: hypothetical protein JSW62_03155 [Thermoplasmatales archaeon]
MKKTVLIIFITLIFMFAVISAATNTNICEQVDEPNPSNKLPSLFYRILVAGKGGCDGPLAKTPLASMFVPVFGYFIWDFSEDPKADISIVGLPFYDPVIISSALPTSGAAYGFFGTVFYTKGGYYSLSGICEDYSYSLK